MTMIPLEQIIANPGQPRKAFPQEHIERLAASIKVRGLIQPIALRRIAADRYMIVAGECRFRAHQLLGEETIRAEVVEIDENEMALRAIVENLQRQDMNPIEEANAFQLLLDQGFDAQRIVTELGLKSTALVQQRVLLLRLIPEVQALVASGQLASTMAGGVAHLPPARQIAMVRAISAGKFTTSEQVKHACIALRDAENQLDAFGEMPRASEQDLAALSRLERKINLVADMIQSGFKEGECVAAQRVSPDRLLLMADRLVLVRKHVLQMEHDLRRVATTTDLLNDRKPDAAESQSPRHKATVGVSDRQRTKGRREQNVADTVPRNVNRSRVKARR
jgi:ParB family chromosome partitioning protein